MRLALPRLSILRPASGLKTPAGRGRRARSAMISGAIVFVAANLMLGWVSERNARIRDPLYGDKFQKLVTRWNEPDRGPCIVMFGSSRTGFAFHGTKIEDQARSTGRPIVAFNFGIPATGPIAHRLYLGRMLKAGVKPDLILFEILPSMYTRLPFGPSEAAWLYGDRLLAHELEIVEHYGFPSTEVRSRWREATFLPFYGIRFQLLGRVIQSWIPWQFRYDWSRSTDQCGWGTPYKEVLTADDRAFAEKHARQEYFQVLRDWQLGEESSRALRDLLADCRADGIPVKLVLLPEGAEFRSWYSPRVRGELDRFLDSTGCEVIDAREWLDDLDFTDGHHQLRSGAAKFSQRLTETVILPWLNGTGR